MMRRALSIGSMILAVVFARGALGQTVGFVAVGGGDRAARLAAVRLSEALEGSDGFEVVSSTAVRQALAAMPSPGGGDDPLADLRREVRRARGEHLRQSLLRIGERLGLDLLVTVRAVGRELELRGFNVSRAAFYQGTLMIPAEGALEPSEVAHFIAPRARGTVRRGEGGEGHGAASSSPRRSRTRRRWWVWAVVGGAVAAAVLVGLLVHPDAVEDQGVTLRLVAP